MKKFNDWFFELEGFGMRCERFYDELSTFRDDISFGKPESLIVWLQAAYEAGQESTSAKVDDKVYETLDVEFSDEELLEYMKMAHEMDITFNQLIHKALVEALRKDNERAD